MNLLLRVLMLSLLSAGSVVEDFEQSCGHFFANRTSPTRFNGKDYKQICQTLDNSVHFATFYDTLNRIPVYSAYVFEGLMRCKRKDKWYIEPQLDDNNGRENMAFSKALKKNERGVHQALNKDYKNSNYDRGHLAPVYHARSQGCADATFTLTNAAPQMPDFNHEIWWNLEEDIANFLSKICTKKGYPAYVVTGVVPGNGQAIKNRVNVPSYFWTAFCCLDQINVHTVICAYSGGAIGTNDNNGNVTRMPLSALETELEELYGTTFKLFSDSLFPNK